MKNFFTPLGYVKLLAVVILILITGTFAYIIETNNEEKLVKKEVTRMRRLGYLHEKINNLEIAIVEQDTTSLEGKKKYESLLDTYVIAKSVLDLDKSPSNKKLPDDLPLTLLVLALVTLTGLISNQFLSSFRSNAKSKNETNSESNESSVSKSFDYDFLQWITENEIINSAGNLDLDKAKTWKKLYDLGLKLGDQRMELISSVQYLLDTELRQENSDESRNSNLFEVFEDVQIRLKQECTRLNNQALLNLFISFFLAFSLLIFNGYVALNTTFDPLNKLKFETFILIYFPKMLAVLSILTMFLYFIRLYKTNVIDVKYYQNEITNVEIKLASLKLALISGNQDVINVLVKDLSGIERNSFFNKDQTSMEIERLKLENEMTKDFLSKTFEFFGVVKEKFGVNPKT